MAKLASKHRTSNICLPTCKMCLPNQKFGGGETSKQGHAVETISCQANNVGQFRQALRQQQLMVMFVASGDLVAMATVNRTPL